MAHLALVGSSFQPKIVPLATVHKRSCRSLRAQASLNLETPPAAPPAFKQGDWKRPGWAGAGPISALVNYLISIKPLYNVMKGQARAVLINTAEKNGVPWTEMARTLEATQEVYDEKERLEDKSMVYPDYYLRPFHAYEDGNLCWQAAFEVEAASLSMCRRAIPSAPSVDAAVAAVRQPWIDAIKRHHQQFSGGLPIQKVVDVGCSCGLSTTFIASAFPEAEVTGLDLSAYFLAVASYRQKQQQQQQQQEEARRVQWLHANGEATGLPAQSVDLVSLAFVVHECPERAIRGLLREAKRILRPGGTVAIKDNDPKSEVIQKLPPPIAVLMKSTEPHSDEYYSLDFANIFAEEGFLHHTTILTDPRHRTVTGTAP